MANDLRFLLFLHGTRVSVSTAFNSLDRELPFPPPATALCLTTMHQLNPLNLVKSMSPNCPDSWLFYNAIYLKSLGYVLPNCFFQESVLQKLQSLALRSFLAKCGYNRNTQRTIVFAPICYGGCGFTPLYLLQGEGQILAFLKHWRTDSDAGNLLRIALAWIQLHVGTSFCFLIVTTTPLPHLPGRWLRSLHTFLAQSNGSIELDHYFLPPTQRERDVYIMDLIIHRGTFMPSEIRLINYC
jgi:hypothetical protein